MDAVEFLKIEKRMCDTFEFCCGCPIRVLKERENMECREFMSTYPEECISIVEKWAEEHPSKTNKDKFIEVFGESTLKNTTAYERGKPKTVTIMMPDHYDWWDEEYIMPQEV